MSAEIEKEKIMPEMLREPVTIAACLYAIATFLIVMDDRAYHAVVREKRDQQ